MNRREFLIGAAVTGAALGLASRPADGGIPGGAADSSRPHTSTGAFDISDRAQLFIDQDCVRSSQGIAFTLHPAQKQPLNPLLKVSEKWEGWRIMLSGTVLYDFEDRVFKMWYLGEASAWFPDYAIFYAVSADGICWEKPLVGTISCPGLARHNAVLASGMVASVIKDNSDPDTSRRYKMIARNYRTGTGGGPLGPKVLTSPDGFHWTRLSADAPFRTDDDVFAFFDSRRRLYVAMTKMFVPVRGFVRRCFAMTTSADLLHWTDPRFVFQPDLRDDEGALARIAEARPLLDVPDDPAMIRTEFYSVGVYQAESCLVAFPSVFTINNQNRFGTSQEGPSEIQLAVSRDLEHWQRPFRVPVIPRGRPGEWDCGFFLTSSQALRYGDEIRLYYSCGNYTHGTPALYHDVNRELGRRYTSSIGLATWPLDRFVSADGGQAGGVLVTIPVQFSGSRLEINVNAAHGRLTVTLLDAAGRPLPGFGSSDPLTADSLRATVTWQGRSDLSALAASPVSFRFELWNTELYSFTVRA